MSKMTPQEMAAKIGSGLLSFPVTPFKADYSFDEATYRANMDWLCGYEVAGLVAAGGTGCKAVKLTAPNAAEVLYANKVMKNLPGGVVLYNGHIYGFSDS
ncbi:MAG: 5-dehydro-4-deoxyglucarate dehydratase, partial [Bradyrhizobium sp.]